MSNLNPGGNRSQAFSRIFGYNSIKHWLQKMKRDYSRDAHTSIATGNRHGGPHLHKREIARRLRRGA